jgi:hypothetical protein
MLKKFSPVQPREEDQWKHTRTILRFITFASPSTLQKIRQEKQTPVRVKLAGTEVISAIFDGSEKVEAGEDFYLTQIDLWSRECTCECKKFRFSAWEEPCKHVVSALITILQAKEFTSMSASEILDVAVAQDRFIGGHRLPWEWKPEFSHETAAAYHFRVEKTFMNNRMVTCYREMVREDGKTRPGKAWRGPLPLPEPKDILSVTLPHVDGPVQVEVIERNDSDSYIGFLCCFVGLPPERYPSRVTVFGADITRTIYEEARQSTE